MDGLEIKKRLKEDFGIDLDIAGGGGRSRSAPIHVLSDSEFEATKNELLVLSGLGMGRRILWRIRESSYVDEGEVIQRKIDAIKVTKSQIIRTTENYYFLRPNLSHSEKIYTNFLSFEDSPSGVTLPYKLSWLRYQKVVDYAEQGRKDLGYGLEYGAPGIKSTIYLYPGESSLQTELDRAIIEYKTVYGDDAIGYEWDVKRTEHSIWYYFIPKESPEKISIIVVMRKGGYIVKVRATFIDELFMREVFGDYLFAVENNVSPDQVYHNSDISDN